MSNVLWTFGDSMTFGHGCNVNCFSDTKLEYDSYKKEGDDIWPNHLAKLQKCNVNNFGKNGVSNDFILDSIIDNFDSIKENDIVIINMTLYGRMDVPIDNNIHHILSSYEGAKNVLNKNCIDNEDKIETIVNFQYYFSNDIFYKNRHKKRFDFIKKRLLNENKVKFCYIWSLEDDDELYASFETIYKHTNGLIKDTHFSFNGHLSFAHFLNSMIDKKIL